VIRRVEYVVVLAEGVRKRHMHETDRGRVIRFVVQLEVLAAVAWQPVIRYGCAHGFTHRDLYDPDGTVTKEGLDLSLDVALTYGDWDINEHWEQYTKRFMKGK
jgi:hypothetical protein